QSPAGARHLCITPPGDKRSAAAPPLGLQPGKEPVERPRGGRRRPILAMTQVLMMCVGRFNIFWTIALPRARPALAAVAIFTFLHSWNSFREPLVFITSSELYTLPVALTQFTDVYGGPMWNTQLAASTMAAVPILIVFAFAQRQVVEGPALSGRR